jgi:hypothetical protein
VHEWAEIAVSAARAAGAGPDAVFRISLAANTAANEHEARTRRRHAAPIGGRVAAPRSDVIRVRSRRRIRA